MKDLYEILGVAPDADLATIRKSYHKLALKHHPDRNGGSKESEEKFRKISAAYSTLSDDKQRKIYDRERSRPAPRPAPGGSYTAPAPQGQEWSPTAKKYEATRNSYFWKASERRRAQNQQRTRHVQSQLSSWDDTPGTGIEAPFDMTTPLKVVRNEPVLGETTIKVVDPFGNVLPGFSVWRKKENA